MIALRGWTRGLLLGLLGAVPPSQGAGQATPPRPPAGATQPQRATPLPLPPPSAFAALAYRNIGPNGGGRSMAVSGSAQRPREYVMGALGGGVWKSVDGGTTWRPLTDGQLRSAAVGAIAVAPSHPDTIYIGMGEAGLAGDLQLGDGIYRSIDGGRTWVHQGLTETQSIARIRVHPKNGAMAWVAAFGRPWERHPARGVYRTLDAGRTWDKVLYRGDSVGAVDIAIDAGKPGVVYAAMWQAARRPWSQASRGGGSGLFKSVDAGDSWTELTRNPGFPRGVIGRIGISVSPVDGNRVYAIVDADSGGVFASDDGGATWRRTSSESALDPRAIESGRVEADPQERERVYVLGMELRRSDDGGRTFTAVGAGQRGGVRDLWIDPKNSARLALAGDRGTALTEDGGRSFTASRLPIAEADHVSATHDIAYQVCGARLGGTTVCQPGTPRATTGFDTREGAFGDWVLDVRGGTSGAVEAHPTDPNIIIAGGADGVIQRLDRRTMTTREERPGAQSDTRASATPERWRRDFPVRFAPLEPNIVYAGSQRVWRSTDGGQSWQSVSSDLTLHADSTRPAPSGLALGAGNAAESFGTISTISPSPRERGIVWTGSDDGLVHLTRDGGATWTNVTPKDLPALSRISRIEASPHAPEKAIIVARRDELGDRSAHVWRTSDFGATWTNISDGFRSDAFVHVVREDPVRAGLLFAGTEHGVYMSFDDGARWQPLTLNLPDVRVSDLQIADNDLVVGTHGRSIWIVDDITVLRQLDAEALKPPLHIFEPPPATRRLTDAVVDYHLSRVVDSVAIEVRDAAGTLIRRVVSTAADTAIPPAPVLAGNAQVPPIGHGRPTRRAGHNRFVWDLRYSASAEARDTNVRDAMVPGPLAPPGEYQIRIAAGGETKTQRLAVVRDPRRADVSDADLRARFDLAMQLRDEVRQGIHLLAHAHALGAAIDASPAPNSRSRAIAAEAQRLTRAIRTVEDSLSRSGGSALMDRLAALQRTVNIGDGLPDAETRRTLDALSRALAAQQRVIDTIVQTDLPALNRRLAARGQSPIPIPAPPAR